MNIDFDSLKKKSHDELVAMAVKLGVKNAEDLRPMVLLYKVIEHKYAAEGFLYTNGVIEILPDGYGFLRLEEHNYTSSQDDVYVSPSQIKRFGLKTGDTIWLLNTWLFSKTVEINLGLRFELKLSIT